MIYCPDHNLLFLEIPKNATTTVSTYLLEKMGGERVNSPVLEGSPGWSSGRWPHGMEIPPEIPGDATVFTTIRRPLSRAFSIWDHACLRHASAFGWPDPAHGDPYPFDQFAWWLARNGPRYDYPRWNASAWHCAQRGMYAAQWELLWHSKVDVLVRSDHLDEDLVRVGIPKGSIGEIGIMNRGSQMRAREASADAMGNIDRWALNDLETLYRGAEKGKSWPRWTEKGEHDE